ncbi:MAG: flagellar hook protein FlgE [bacterium]
MMRSMYAGVSGLRVHQTKMDVISNNIANINTVGFKRSSTSFKDSFNQTLAVATGATDVSGGTNAQQVGLGSNVGSVVTVHTQGAAQRTDYGSDLMIDGDGFFIIQSVDGYSFTRAGVFEVDANGNLVDANGNYVCGWNAVEDTENPGNQKIVKDVVSPINIYEGDKQYSPASETTTIEFTGNFNETSSPIQKNTISFYDTQGNYYTLELTFTRYSDLNDDGSVDENSPFLDANVWAVHLPTNDLGGVNVTVNGGDTMSWNTIDIENSHIVFGTDGLIKNVDGTDATAGDTFLTLGAVDTAEIYYINPDGTLGESANIGGIVNTQQITIEMPNVTQFNSSVTLTSQTLDGNTAGAMTGYSIDGNGIISATYSNGKTKILNQLSIANFANPAGLEKIGGNTYAASNNSGDFDLVGFEVSALGSSIQAGALEMSNVDLSFEFSEMITTQRGFQANSKIITTSDEMIQELVNLKR